MPHLVASIHKAKRTGDETLTTRIYKMLSLNSLAQRFLNFLWPCTPSVFRYMSMCTPKHGCWIWICSREGPLVDFPGVGQKYFCRGLKVEKLHFHSSKLRKQPFLQKYYEKMSSFKIQGSVGPFFDANVPKTSYDKKAEGVAKRYLPIKHMTIFEINIHWHLMIYFNILLFEPDTKSMQHKHTLPVQHRLVIIDTEHLVTALLVG